MLKNLLGILGVLLLINCAKKDENSVTENEYIPLKYDTIPIDSFTYKKNKEIMPDSLKNSKPLTDSIIGN